MQLWKLPQQLVQRGGDVALHPLHEDPPEQHRNTLKAILDRLELLAQQLGNAREDVHVLDDDHREPEIRGIHQLRTLGNPRHLELALVGLLLLRPFDARGDGVAHLDGAPEGLGDAVDGEVVVGGSDPPGGEDEVVGCAHLPDLFGDGIDVVGNGDDPLDVHAERAQLATEIGRVGVCNLPREDLVSDDENASRSAWLQVIRSDSQESSWEKSHPSSWKRRSWTLQFARAEMQPLAANTPTASSSLPRKRVSSSASGIAPLGSQSSINRATTMPMGIPRPTTPYRNRYCPRPSVRIFAQSSLL